MMKNKTCSKCVIEKLLEHFYKTKNGRLGYSSICKTCEKIRGAQYYKKNKEKICENGRNNIDAKQKKKDKYNKLTKEEKLIKSEYSKKYREENKERIRISRKKYRKENKEIIRERKRIYSLNKRKIDPLFKLKGNIRCLIRNSLKYKKNNKTSEILGCTFEEFKTHLESQWTNWMSWNNYGKYDGKFNQGWDIDHIIPLSSANTKEKIIKLNHYTNLQPLCSHINRDIKKDNII